jgi:uncharacterized protein
MNTLLIAVLLLGATSPQEGVRYPAKPGPRDFILDEAKVLKADDATEIRILCDEALTKKKAPIVVTIPSLAAYGAGGWPIERYALNLMSEWGVGWPEWNYGMLLLVSIGDRKARIELGGSWERRKDDDAKRVMSERVLPHFKKGDPSKGILEGVRGLHDIALDAMPSRAQPRRGAPVPTPGSAPVPGVPSSGFGCLPVLLAIVVGGVILMFVFRMLRRGSVTSWGNRGPYGGGYSGGGGGGFGSSFGGGLLGGALGSMLGGAVSRRYDSSSPPPPASYGGSDSSSSSDSSDYGGGSFGGGFSGGGGATGEW